MIIINTHQKILNCNIFIKFSWVNMPPNGPNPFSKVWLHYHEAMCSVFQKKNLDPLDGRQCRNILIT